MPNNHYEVPSCWKRNLRRTAGALSTNGTDLMSYGLVIGVTSKHGKKVVIDYTKSNHYSTTTSRHVNGAKQYADLMVAPPDVRRIRDVFHVSLDDALEMLV
jgi:hypothetical protein